MPVDTPMTNEMERTPYVTESLRVRCPACRKLYLVQFGDIQEAKPRFECVQCRGRFWLSLPDMDLASELVGIPLQVKDVPMTARKSRAATDASARGETEPCPKCAKPVALGASECGSCGVMISKARDVAAAGGEPRLPAATPMLESLWKKVIADYGDPALHAEFVRLAEKERALPYAAAQYAQMLKLMPTDEVTQSKVREVQALATLIMPPREPAMAAGFVSGSAGSSSSGGESKLNRPRKYVRLWQLPLMAATVLIIVGLLIPFFRNLVGVGAAFLFLAVAVQFQFNRRG